jgi:hypothetical protein
MPSTDCEILNESIPVLDAVNCCDHETILCDGELRVTNIVDTSGIFKGIIPPDIGDLTELIFFHVEDGELEGELPSSITKLKKLVKFSLHRTRVSGQLPNALGEMTSLAHFRVFDSFVDGEIPRSICLLKELRYLYLGLNKLTGLL